MEPSMTSTNGASSWSSSAWRNGRRNSSPPSVGESTLLWRWTFGSPGMAPSRTSSMLGWPAAVMETESPSQLMPSEIHRMWTSSTPCATGSAAIPGSSVRRRVLELQCIHEQLLAPEQLQVPAAAARAMQREAVQLALRPAATTAAGRGDLLHHELRALHAGALGHQLEGELERRGDHLAQMADLEVHRRHRPPGRVLLRDPDHRLGDGELVHAALSRSAGAG